MKIGLLIQARSNSKRLPNKIFAEIGAKPMLLHIWERVQRVPAMEGVEYVPRVLIHEHDRLAEDFCILHIMPFCKGSEDDLISRYRTAIEKEGLDAAIRITGDCWNIPSQIIHEAVKALQSVDYVSNTMLRTYPEGWDIQGGTKRAWDWLDQAQTTEREHPFKILDANEIIQNQFSEAGMKINVLCNRQNIIFQKNSIDNIQDLERARDEYRRQTVR